MLLCSLLGCSNAPEAPGAPGYGRDVAPILDTNCVSCHHARGVATFALDIYEEARASARTIVAVTEQRLMPPFMPAPAACRWWTSGG